MRVEAVQRQVLQTVSDPLSVPILVTTLDLADNSADRIDIVTRKFRDMAPPILPKPSGGQDSSGSSSSGGAPSH